MLKREPACEEWEAVTAEGMRTEGHSRRRVLLDSSRSRCGEGPAKLGECIEFLALVAVCISLTLFVAETVVDMFNAPKELGLFAKFVHCKSHWFDRDRDKTSLDRKFLYGAVFFGVVGWVLLKASELL